MAPPRLAFALPLSIAILLQGRGTRAVHPGVTGLSESPFVPIVVVDKDRDGGAATPNKSTQPASSGQASSTSLGGAAACPEPPTCSQWSVASFLSGVTMGIMVCLLIVGLLMERKAVTGKGKGSDSVVDGVGGSTRQGISGSSQPTEAPENFVEPCSEDGLLAPRLHPSDAPTGKTSGSGESEAACPPTADSTESLESLHLYWPRCGCLMGMLMIQSISSLILAGFQDLIAKHASLVYFLTMIVGLGGNAGGQSVVLAVRRLAIGSPVSILEQFKMGLMLSLLLSPLAFFRALVQRTTVVISLVVALATFAVTIIATSFGTAIPRVLFTLRIDPAHAASIIQVFMDIGGIILVCTLGAIVTGVTD